MTRLCSVPRAVLAWMNGLTLPHYSAEYCNAIPTAFDGLMNDYSTALESSRALILKVNESTNSMRKRRNQNCFDH